MIAPAPKEKCPESGHLDAQPRTFASDAAAALYIVIGASTGSDDLDRLVSQIWRGVVHWRDRRRRRRIFCSPSSSAGDRSLAGDAA